MSHLSTQKVARFSGVLAMRLQDASFAARQAEYEQRTAASNAELTEYLAACREKGVPPTEADLSKFPPLGPSPMEELRREIYRGMAA